MTDDLLRRMRAADPVPPEVNLDLGGPRVDALVEAVVTTDLQSKTPVPARPRRRWVPAAAVTVAALAAVGIGAQALLTPPASPPVASKPLTLALPDPADAAIQMCLAFSVEALRPMPVAFSGTVTDVAGQTVTLDVDHWYRGGTAGTVELVAPGFVSPALLESVDLVEGKRYLITATDGNVNICGFSAEWSADKAAAFEQAFG